MDAFTPSGGYVGTDALRRPLTKLESLRLSKLLRDHDYAGASLIALRFAFKLTKHQADARDILGRVQVRLVEKGWDPAVVPLPAALNRFVWSETTHSWSERRRQRKAEEKYVARQAADGDHVTRSPEQNVLRLEEEREQEAFEARRSELLRTRFAALKAHFETKGDQVNLAWCRCVEEGFSLPRDVKQRTGHDDKTLNAATKRRERAIVKLLAVASEERRAQMEQEDETGEGSWA